LEPELIISVRPLTIVIWGVEKALRIAVSRWLTVLVIEIDRSLGSPGHLASALVERDLNWAIAAVKIHYQHIPVDDRR
jgi:hypothetical protein